MSLTSQHAVVGVSFQQLRCFLGRLLIRLAQNNRSHQVLYIPSAFDEVQSQCVQKYVYHRMLSFDPCDSYKGLFIDIYKLPSA